MLLEYGIKLVHILEELELVLPLSVTLWHFITTRSLLGAWFTSCIALRILCHGLNAQKDFTQTWHTIWSRNVLWVFLYYFFHITFCTIYFLIEDFITNTILLVSRNIDGRPKCKWTRILQHVHGIGTDNCMVSHLSLHGSRNHRIQQSYLCHSNFPICGTHHLFLQGNFIER